MAITPLKPTFTFSSQTKYGLYATGILMLTLGYVSVKYQSAYRLQQVTVASLFASAFWACGSFDKDSQRHDNEMRIWLNQFKETWARRNDQLNSFNKRLTAHVSHLQACATYYNELTDAQKGNLVDVNNPKMNEYITARDKWFEDYTELQAESEHFLELLKDKDALSSNKELVNWLQRASEVAGEEFDELTNIANQALFRSSVN